MTAKKTNYIVCSSIFASYVLQYFVMVYVTKEWDLERFTQYVIESSTFVTPRNMLKMLQIYFSVPTTDKLFDLMVKHLADSLLKELDNAQGDSPIKD